MNTITQSDIELSERLRKACLENGITEPRFVAQDKNGHWYHYTNIPDAYKYFFSAIYASDDPILEDRPNENWRETLMEFVKPTIEEGKRYWRRDGSITSALDVSRIANCFVCPDTGINYWRDGVAYAPHKDNSCEIDLIAEYTGEPLSDIVNRTCEHCGKTL